MRRKEKKKRNKIDGFDGHSGEGKDLYNFSSLARLSEGLFFSLDTREHETKGRTNKESRE